MKFEYEKRQKKISETQTKIHHFEHEERIKDEEYDEWYGRYQNEHGYAAAGEYRPPSTEIREQTRTLNDHLHITEMEMEVIEKALNQKWETNNK